MPGTGFQRADLVAQRLGDDVAAATRRAAVAGMVPVVLDIVAVVESELFAGAQIAHGEDPDVSAAEHGPKRRAPFGGKFNCSPPQIAIAKFNRL